ncbi:MAG: reverse transcriptase/maturase family protein [Acidobacteriia bacterium]|nr:reverse transcriptase/maturase family protein [Terriglobia bacterium]
MKRQRRPNLTHVIFCVQAVVSPLLANLYLHHVFDLWVEAWRGKVAKGKVMAIRYADDLVVGFERRDEAERFLKEFGERLAKFGLELHPEKTRLIEFGPNAARERGARGEGKPESFTFLGFAHADAPQPHARASTEGRRVVETCAGRPLPILRRTGEPGEFGVVSGEDSPLLGPVLTTALTKGESLCHPVGSPFHTLVASSQGGASLPGAALCRYPSKVRAVCVNHARTALCGGCEATRIPTATAAQVRAGPAPRLLLYNRSYETIGPRVCSGCHRGAGCRP